VLATLHEEEMLEPLLALAGFDEGIVSLCRPISLLYG
jgi:hypothetical protein